MAILLGLIYFQQPYEDRRIMNINGALFILLTSVSFNNTLAVINVSKLGCSFQTALLRKQPIATDILQRVSCLLS